MEVPAKQGTVAEHTATGQGREARQTNQNTCVVAIPQAPVSCAGPRRCCAAAPQLQAVENRQKVLEVFEIAGASGAPAAEVLC